MSDVKYLKDLILIVDNFIEVIKPMDIDSILKSIGQEFNVSIYLDRKDTTFYLIDMANAFKSNGIQLTLKFVDKGRLKISISINSKTKKCLLDMRSKLDKEIINSRLENYLTKLKTAEENYNHKLEITKENSVEYVEYIINILAYNIEVNGDHRVRVGKELDKNMDKIIDLLNSIPNIECCLESEINDYDEENVWYAYFS